MGSNKKKSVKGGGGGSSKKKAPPKVTLEPLDIVIPTGGSSSKQPVLQPDGNLTIHVYLVHATHLVQRKANFMELVKVLNAHPRIDVVPTLVSAHDPSDITQQDVQSLVCLNRGGGTPQDAPSKWDQQVQNMHVNQVSNALKHLKCLHMISNSAPSAPPPQSSVHLVLEDDIMYPPDVADRFLAICERLPRDHDIAFLGQPGQPLPPDQVGYTFVPQAFPVLPCCESYIVSPAAATKLLSKFLPIRFSANKQLSFAIEQTLCSSLQATPNLFSDGSKVGSYCSTLSPNTGLMFDATYMAAWKALHEEQEQVTQEQLRQLETALAESPLKDHADILHMRARIVARQGRHQEANEVFASADSAYERSHAIINGESEFLQAYCDNFKYLQGTTITN